MHHKLISVVSEHQLQQLELRTWAIGFTFIAWHNSINRYSFSDPYYGFNEGEGAKLQPHLFEATRSPHLRIMIPAVGTYYGVWSKMGSRYSFDDFNEDGPGLVDILFECTEHSDPVVALAAIGFFDLGWTTGPTRHSITDPHYGFGDRASAWYQRQKEATQSEDNLQAALSIGLALLEWQFSGRRYSFTDTYYGYPKAGALIRRLWGIAEKSSGLEQVIAIGALYAGDYNITNEMYGPILQARRLEI